jgi:hypothetical protein
MCPLAERVVLTVATVLAGSASLATLSTRRILFGPLHRIFSGPLHQQPCQLLLVCSTILQAETVVKPRNDRPWPVHVTSLRVKRAGAHSYALLPGQ